MSKEVRRTFSKRLSRTILILAVPLFVLSLGVFYQYARELLERETAERSRTILRTTERLVDNHINAIETAAKANVWAMEENFTPDSLKTIAQRIVSLNPSVLSCSVAAEPNSFPDYGDNFSVYSVRDIDTVITVLEPEFEYYEKNWYKKPMQMGRPCWINPFSDFNEGTINHHDAVGSYCMPLRPQSNRIEGIVTVDFSFQRLRETVLATHHPYPSSYYMILGPSGGYLVHPNSSLLFKKTIFTATDSVEHPDIIELGRAMTTGKQGTTHVTIDDRLCHVTYMPVSDTGWSIALVCDDDDVLADYNHLTIVLIVFIVVGLLLIVWIIRRGVQHSIGHLNELMEATKKIAEGDYQTLIPLSDHNDVVGKLQNAFRKMQQAIIAHLEETKQTDAELESKSAEIERILTRAQEASRRRQTFIKNVSRQILTPLNAIEALTAVLRNNINSRKKAEISQLTTTLKHNSLLLQRNTLMLYDSSDVGLADSSRYKQREDVLCNQFAKECIDYTEKLFYISPIQFTTQLPDDFKIRTNQLFLMRTVRELLYNAAKFSDGKHITLKVSQTDTAVLFIVEDIGPGLPKNAEELIFEPFTKGDDLAEGLGLGLPLCKTHVKALGGSLVYDDSYHQGCRFIVEIPKENT